MGAILQVFYSAFSGALLSLAIPNEFFYLGFPLVSLIALLPYYFAIKNCRNYKQAFLCGFFQAGITHLLSSFWLAYFMNFAAFTLGASAFGTGMIGAFFGVFLFLPYNSSKKQNKLLDFSLEYNIFRSLDFKIFYFAALYTLYEWVKSTGYLGYPWGTVSSSLYKWNIFTQLASITGTYGLTFMAALFNAILGERILCAHRTQSPLPRLEDFLARPGYFFRINFRSAEKVFALFLILQTLFGTYQLLKSRVPEKYLTTIMVQQNSDP